MQILLHLGSKLENSLTINDPNMDLVIAGIIECADKVSVRVGNLIVLAGISNPENVEFEAIQDIYLLGPKAGPLEIKYGGSLYASCSQDVIEKINQLGINVVQKPNGAFSLTLPNRIKGVELI